MRIHIILLAAGNSRRFGTNKLFYEMDEKPMYLHTAEKIQTLKETCPFVGELLIVSQYEQILETLKGRGFTTVYNSEPERGISHSIRLGLEKIRKEKPLASEDGIAFFVCDQPYLKEGTLVRFFEAFAGQRDDGIGCLSYGRDLGNPVIFRAAYMEELLALSGDVGGKKVVRSHLEEVYAFPVEDPQELKDLDRREALVLVRGGGDVASGAIFHLWQAGYPVAVLEVETPTCIRRQVSFGEAVCEGKMTVDGVTSVHVKDEKEMFAAWENDQIPVLVDPEGNWIRRLCPDVVIDGILAKKNLGTKREMAPLTIGLGPGFTAKEDVDFVVETMRGSTLGDVYEQGTALPNTGVPGLVGGYAKERVLHAKQDGVFRAVRRIGDGVKKDEKIAMIGEEPVFATIDGILRGQIRDGFSVKKGLKIMDIEPRISELETCFHISDKAHKIGESVTEIVNRFFEEKHGRQKL